MGWENRKKKEANSSGYWDYWHGAWYKDKPPPSRETKTLLVPYDQLQVDSRSQNAELEQMLSSTGAHGSADSIVKSLQQCVNAARKAENRVKKLLSDKALKNAQWERYQKDVRAAFTAEKRRHNQHLEKLEQELLKAVEVQEEARTRVRLAAQGHSGGDEAMDAEEEETDSWLAQLMEDEAEPPPDDSVLQEVLARALQPASAEIMPTPCVAPSAVPKTPQRQVIVPRTPVPKPKVSRAKAPGILAGAQASGPGAQAPGHAVPGFGPPLPTSSAGPSGACLQFTGAPCARPLQPPPAHDVGAIGRDLLSADALADRVLSAQSLGTSSHPQQVNVQPTPGPTLTGAHSSRLTPFPPPRAPAACGMPGQYLGHSPSVVSDPYVNATIGLAPAFSPARALSPPVSKPRTQGPDAQ